SAFFAVFFAACGAPVYTDGYASQKKQGDALTLGLDREDFEKTSQMLEEKHLDRMLESMMGLNYKSSQIALRFGVNAMSDVTGFG
ncbi:hypothetical protein VWM68_10165, partial [Campylobacter coli]